jgi:hypothetical protein
MSRIQDPADNYGAVPRNFDGSSERGVAVR